MLTVVALRELSVVVLFVLFLPHAPHRSACRVSMGMPGLYFGGFFVNVCAWAADLSRFDVDVFCQKTVFELRFFPKKVNQDIEIFSLICSDGQII